MQRLAIELRLDRGYDFRIAVTDVEDAEAAETVEILFSGNVAIAVGSGVGPLDRRGRVFDRRRLPIFEKPRVDVIAETLDRFPRDPLRVLGGDRGRLYQA